MSRVCTVCREAIPAKRLTAIPTATECVPCLEAAGDVQKVRRYDEATRDGMVETYFTNNQYVELAQQRQNLVRPSNTAFAIAVGDDSTLRRERGFGVATNPYELIDEEIDAQRYLKARKQSKQAASAKAAA